MKILHLEIEDGAARQLEDLKTSHGYRDDAHAVTELIKAAHDLDEVPVLPVAQGRSKRSRIVIVDSDDPRFPIVTIPGGKYGEPIEIPPGRHILAVLPDRPIRLAALPDTGSVRTFVSKFLPKDHL